MNKLLGLIKYIYTQYGTIPMTNFRGSHLILNRSKYNRSWDNERTIEVPLIQEAYESLGISKFNEDEINILEIGNVLSNYERKLKHDIIDKYEKSPRVKNVDFLDYKTKKKYDYIFSISTFEHIGYDYGEKKDTSKSLKAMRKVLTMLKPKGKAYITIPVGFNPELDEEIRKGIKGYSLLAFKRTKNWGNTWEQCDPQDTINLRYGVEYPNANSILVLFRDMNKYNLELDSEEMLLMANTLKEVYEMCNQCEKKFEDTERIIKGMIPKFGELIEEEKEW